LILVLMAGSALTIADYVPSPSIKSIIYLWYSGEEGGHALTDVIFGSYAPSGKLDNTFPVDESRIPDDANYNMTAGAGRTYRYSTIVPLFNFGYGMSYTQFTYTNMSHSFLSVSHISHDNVAAQGNITATFQVKNIGSSAGDEIVQLYVTVTPSKPPTPIQSIPRTELKAFTRVSLAAGESRIVVLNVSVSDLYLVGPDGTLQLLDGVYSVFVGGSSPGSRGLYVDGHNHHATHIISPRPQLSDLPYCIDTDAWSSSHSKPAIAINRIVPQSDLVQVKLDFSIAGGLTQIFSVC